MLARCPTHSGRSDIAGPAFPSDSWSFLTKLAPGPISIAAEGTLLFSTDDGILFAVSSSGTELWSVKLGDYAGEAVAIAADGTVYAPSANGLHALTLQGTKKWSFSVPGINHQAPSPVIAPDGRILFGAVDGTIYSLLPDGTVSWSLATKGHFQQGFALSADSIVYATSSPGALYALTTDGKLLWSFGDDSSTFSPPVLGADGTIYVIADGLALHALSPDGKEKWSRNYSLHGTPALASDGTIYAYSDALGLMALSPEGAKLWALPVNDQYGPNSLTVDGAGNVFFGTTSMLQSVSSKGKILWTHAMPSGARTSPSVGADGRLYVPCNDDRVRVIGP
jgi:outer membrane protein assembly factor BamB